MLVRLSRKRHRDESGSTLVTVLVIMLVITLFSITLATVVTSTTRSLVQTRETAQAHQAADAGLAVVLSAFKRESACPATQPSSLTDPIYETICEESGDQVTFTSTGHSGPAQTKTVAVYQIIPDEAPPTAGGPGLFYTYGLNTRMNSYVFDDVNSEVGIDEFIGSAGVYASTGKIECGSGSVFPGDIYTKTGELQIDSGCLVEGNAYIGSKAFVNGGTIKGSLIAPSTTSHTISGTIGTSGGSDGNVFLGGTFTLNNGTVYGSVSAAGAGSNTLGSGTIHGNFIHKGSYGIWGTPASSIVKGAIVKNTGLAAPTLPEIPDWQDVDFTPVNATTPPQAWADAGYKLTTVTGTACNKWAGGATDVTSVAGSLTSRMIFDIRACPDNFDTNNGDANKEVKVNRDIAIITNRWFLSGTKFKSADGQPHTIFLITPDSKPTVAGPQCNWPAQDSQQLNNSTVDPKIAIYLYTPCLMKFNSGTATFRGQVYSGKLEFGGGVKVAFAPRNIPGYDFGEDVDPWPGGGGGGGGGTPTLVLLSQRDVP
ncbi:MAG: pilus assembly PilX N-terminal domain-containing protein [Propionicimonas sp.]